MHPCCQGDAVEEKMVEKNIKVSTKTEDTVPTPSHEQAKSLDLPVFYGMKAGMTRIFDENGNHVPVTVIKLIPNIVSQVKTVAKDGYEAYQIAYYEKKEKLVSAPKKGHLKKANIPNNFYKFAEIKTVNVDDKNIGCEISLETFKPDLYVDATSNSKGKGFQGVVKKFHFAGGPATHGSTFHRAPGSIGNRATPARVYKNKKLPGHLGCEKKTMQNLKVVEVNKEKGYMLISGSIPGGKNSFVKISKSVKK